MTRITRLPSTIDQEEELPAEELLPVLYDKLHRLAVELMTHERPGQTLQATALVDEAYLRLADPRHPQQWHSPGHFYVAAADTMRRILIESTRRKRAARHGGGWNRIPIDSAQPASPEADQDRADEIVAVDEAIEWLAAEEPLKAELVKLRYFAGLPLEQAAVILGISRATADRYWSYARAWLYVTLTRGRSSSSCGKDGT